MKFIATAFFVLIAFCVRAQQPLPSVRTVVIDSIQVTGNHITKQSIILRELPFTIGDTMVLPALPQKMILAKQQLINTSLFVDVQLAYTFTDSSHVVVNTAVKERWYFLPVPYFRLVDRNFNQWWTEQHRSLNRVNYGLKLIQNNVSGHNDNAYLWLINGYNHQVAARYEAPFIDKKLQRGLSMAASFLRQRELNYGTDVTNKQLFYKGNDFVRQQLRIEASYLYRPAIKTRHAVTLRLIDETLSDTILRLNPNYFPYSRNHITYPVINYTVQYSDADNLVYPTNGFVGEASFTKKGFGEIMNLWQLAYRAKYTIPISRLVQLQIQSGSIINLPFKQPFFNKQIVNYYGDIFFRGLEYYVIDGVAATVNRATLRQQVFTYTIKNPVSVKNHSFIPIRFYVKGYGDVGYVYNNGPASRFNNKLITTYGLGLDVVTIYDIVIRFEYSFNALGDHNLYLHSKGDF